VTDRHESAATLPGRDDLDVLDVLDAAVASVPEFAGRKLAFEPMSGGLTNRIYRVGADSTPLAVARVSSRKSSLLAIDREAEMRNAEAAAHAGVGPRVLAAMPGIGISLVEWIDGRTFETRDLDDEWQLNRVAAQCRQLHAGPRFANDFDMFAVQRGYLAVVRERGFRLPPRYLEFMPQVDVMRAALAVHDDGTVPCHNDLLAANILDDGTRLWFIDYEYSGNNDACFELGNIWSEATLPLDRLEHLITAYYGLASRAKLARARLLALMSKYGWTLWASIQDAVSDADFDFWTWGMEKYDRAVAEFDSAEFAALINDVQQPETTRELAK
jgi:thiamine kinase-like enzyme